MRAKLFVVSGRAQKKELEIELPARVGRSDEADLTIVHPTVSRRHCELFARDGELIVRDTGSTNGILVRGNRITEAVLHPDDEFTIGPLTFRAAFCNGPPAAKPHDSKSPAAREPTPPVAVGSNGKNGGEVDELALPELAEDEAGLETQTLPEPDDVAELDAIEPTAAAMADDEALDDLLPDLGDEDMPDLAAAASPTPPAAPGETGDIVSGSTADEDEEAVAELLPELGDDEMDFNLGEAADADPSPQADAAPSADEAEVDLLPLDSAEDAEGDQPPLDAKDDAEVDLLPLDAEEDAEVDLLPLDQEDDAADATLDFEEDGSEELLSLDDADDLAFETESPATTPPVAKQPPAADEQGDAATPPDLSFDDEDSAELVDFLPATDEDDSDAGADKKSKSAGQGKPAEPDDPDLDMFLEELE